MTVRLLTMAFLIWLPVFGSPAEVPALCKSALIPQGESSDTASSETSTVGGHAFQPSTSVDLGSYVTTVALSPGNKYFVAGSREINGRPGRAGIFTLAGDTIASFEGALGDVTSVQYSQDGNTVAMCWADGNCKLSDPYGKPIGSFSGLGYILTTKISPDGRHFAVGGRNGILTLIDLRSGHQQNLLGIQDDIGHLQFSNDGKKLLAAGNSTPAPAIVWDISGNEIYRYVHVDPPNTLISNWYAIAELSPDGQTLVTGFFDGTVQIHNLVTGIYRETMVHKYQPYDPIHGHSDYLERAALSKDGHTLIAAIHSETILLVNLKSSEIKSVKPELAFGGNFSLIIPSPDNSYFIAVNMDRVTSIWDYGGNLIGHLTGTYGGGFPLEIEISNDGRYVIAGTNNDRAFVWQLKDTLGRWTYRAEGTLAIQSANN